MKKAKPKSKRAPTTKKEKAKMKNGNIAELTEVALRIKEGFEDKDVGRMLSVFSPNAKVNVLGRFFTVEEVAPRLKEALVKVEQPSVDILSIEESEIRDGYAFVSYVTEFAWIDSQTWEEHALRGLMSLDLGRIEKGWLVNGFTLARRPEQDTPRDEPPIKPPRVDQPAPSPMSRGSGLNALFSFWY